jgi:hypothetical protein
MKTSEHFTTIIAISEIDNTVAAEARRKFFAYRDKGIIVSGLFDDDKWILSDERDRRSFDFTIDDNAFKTFGTRLNISVNEFKRYLKIYIVNNFGVLALVSLQHIILAIKRTTYVSDTNFVSELSQVDAIWMEHIVDFFSVLPSDEREQSLDEFLIQCEDAVDKSCFSGSGAQRSLATFESYFRFHDILKKYWAEAKDENEKLFFFPVWLWWNITGVIPTRPHEFVLTPRKCLETVDDKSFLIMRKNKVKGSKKAKGYRLKEDFQTVKYQIPTALANEIKWYIDRTESCMDTEISTLLVTETHYHKWERCKPYNSRYFTYTNLRTCLRYFYKQIIQDRYGYNVLMDQNQPVLAGAKDIEYIRLGDTRHIALINLIAEGASPVAAMVLAGHDNPEMSAHYYSNISTLIECRVHRQYKKMLSGEQVYALSVPRSKLSVGESVPCDGGGYCYSEKARHGDYSECYKVTGPAGEMGYCPNCDYYRDSDESFFESKELYTRRIADEGILLYKIVNQVRNGHGDAEDIVSILNRINGAAYSYERYLLEKMEEQNGKEKVN